MDASETAAAEAILDRADGLGVFGVEEGLPLLLETAGENRVWIEECNGDGGDDGLDDGEDVWEG